MINLNFVNPLEERLESIEKEFQLINEMITSRTVQTDYMHEVKSDVFNDPMNKELFLIIKEIEKENKDINVNSIRTHIKLNRKHNVTRQIEDQLDIALSYSATDTFMNIVKDLNTLRKNRILFEEIIGTAKTKFMNNEPVDEIIKNITDSIISMDDSNEDRTTYAEHVENALDEILDPENNKDFLSLRWEEWNKQFGGIIKDRVYLIGGESGSGKTGIVADLIAQLSEDHSNDVAILFFSYEMSQQRIIARLISRMVQFTETKLKQRFKKLDTKELDKIKEAAKFIKKYPLEIVYQTLDDNELKTRVRRFALKNKGKHLIIMLDHIGLVEGDDREMRIKTIKTSAVMKSFARDYKASVFPLTQLKKELTDLNSPANKSSYHRPNDSHIMESGSLKADADVVVLLWRPDMRFKQIIYDGHSDWDVRGKLILCNYKNRDGQSPTDLVLGCEIKYNLLYNLNDPFSPNMTESVREELIQRGKDQDFLEPINVSMKMPVNGNPF